MKKKIVFWCPFFGKVGTANAVIESLKLSMKVKNFTESDKCIWGI